MNNTNTEEKREIGKKLSVVKDLDALVNGAWQLKYKLTNARGLDGFAGIMLENYIDPITKQVRKYVDLSGRVHHGIWIGEIVTTITPKLDMEGARKLDFIIGHPNVQVVKEHVETNYEYLKNKISNPRFTLVNLDYEDISKLENDDIIDILIGRISKNSGTSALSIEKLRWVLATLGISYRYSKYMNDANKEKAKLREALKKYARESIANTEEINKILNDIDNAKFNWQIKEMLRLGILNTNDGAFAYKDNLLATTFVGLKEYFTNNPDLFTKLTKTLLEKLENEISR